jgi:hypothetical protein
MPNLTLDIDNIYNALIAAVIVAIAARSFGRMKLATVSINNRWSAWMLRREIARVESFLTDPSEITRFFLTQLLWCMAIIGVGITFASIAFVDGGLRWVAVICPVVGMSIYIVAIYGIGMVWRSRNASAYLDRLKSRLAILEGRVRRGPN